MIKEIEVKPVRQILICDDCNKEIKFDGIALMGNPIKYKHTCDCGRIYIEERQYPGIEFIEVNND